MNPALTVLNMSGGSAIDIADRIFLLKSLGRPVPKEYHKDEARYLQLRLTTPLQKKQIRERKLNLTQAEELRSGRMPQLVKREKLIPLVPKAVPDNYVGAEANLIVQPHGDKFIILDGNQRYHSSKATAFPVTIYPEHPHPVIQHYRLNRHPLSLAVTKLFKATKLTVDEIIADTGISKPRLLEAFQCIASLPPQIRDSNKHVTIYRLEKVTDPLHKKRGRSKVLPPTNPDDLLQELLKDPTIPDDVVIMDMLARIDRMHNGKAIAVATLLAAYGLIPTIHPNNKLVRKWLHHLPAFIQAKSSQTNSVSPTK